MNILFVYERMIKPTFGGVERVSLLLARELKARGHSVSFLSVGPEEWNMHQVEYGFPQYYIPFSAMDFKPLFEIFLKENKFDVLIFQGNHNTVTGALSVTPHDVPKYVVLHNKPYSRHGNEGYIYRLTPWRDLSIIGKLLTSLHYIMPTLHRKICDRKSAASYRDIVSKADKFVMLSNRYVERISNLTEGIDEVKVTAISNPNTFDPPTDEPKKKKENVVVFVGRLSNPQKNVTGFIDVWDVFHKKHPDWNAYILGDGEHRDIIVRYSKKKGARNLHFEGNRKDIRNYYRRAKILCMTSTYEGWPMVLAEAMAYGCVPVVYDSFEAARDIIDSGKTGYLVRPFDAEEMVARLNSLAEDDALRETMAAGGREKIKEFSVERIVDQWERLLKR